MKKKILFPVLFLLWQCILSPQNPYERKFWDVTALKQNGNPVRYTRYPATGHDAWTRTFADPELYKWMLSQ